MPFIREEGPSTTHPPFAWQGPYETLLPTICTLETSVAIGTTQPSTTHNEDGFEAAAFSVGDRD